MWLEAPGRANHRCGRVAAPHNICPFPRRRTEADRASQWTKRGIARWKGKTYNQLPLNLQERVSDTQLTMYILDAKAPERARLVRRSIGLSPFH